MKNLIRVISILLILFLVLFIFGENIFAQSTNLKLPTTDNTSSFDVTKNDNSNLLRLFGDGGFYIGGTLDEGTIPVEGSGSRLMWYPKKAAFRVGNVYGQQWNDSNIGNYSVAMGYSNTASGPYSTSIGSNSSAFGNSSVSIGDYTSSTGTHSTYIGYFGTSSGENSTAIGSVLTASGENSLALGYNTKSSGFNSTSMGNGTIASGNYSTATGWATTASGHTSTAMGSHVSTNGYNGAFIIGDNSTNTVHLSSANHQMTMRFAGGFRFYSNPTGTLGVRLEPNGNSWVSISDSTKKENYINADGEYFLNSLSQLTLGSWNYKDQDSKEHRHYGPMAQEIFHYFGKDELGTIGNDTTLATADMDGIMMIMLQALEKRTNDLLKAEERVSNLKYELLKQSKNISEQQNLIEALRNELLDTKKIISTLYEEKYSSANNPSSIKEN